MKRDRSNLYPMFAALAGPPMTADEAATAPACERIASIWPFLVQCVLNFQRTLRPRERANFDPEDTLSEIYIELAEKDDKYEPARGKYITFASKVAYHLLCDLRDRAQTVELPKNSAYRLKGYASSAEAGDLTDRRRQTAEAIRRASFEPSEVFDADVPHVDDPAAITTARERAAATHREICTAIARRLTAVEAAALGRTGGLWGREPVSIADLARELGLPPAELRKARLSAQDKIREYVQERGLDLVFE